MASRDPQGEGPDAQTTIDEILGYLNLSAGAADARFERNLNVLASRLIEELPGAPYWQELSARLRARLAVLRGSSSAFGDTEQAEAAIDYAFRDLPAEYLKFHRDLLRHQTPANLFRPFFLARVCEAVLQQGPPWDENERIMAGAIKQMNSFIGHRPVAMLNTRQQAEPYEHEWVAPVPLYLRGTGVGAGDYRELVERALEILAATDAEILEEAYFNPELLDELAFDPRAYDFDHPVNKRPNYQFGMWDPHRLDNQGRYRRFVVQEITLDALRQRLESPGELEREEVLFEGAAVLAGTILMASGVSGRSPETHDSSVTLAKLVPRIAAYRDEFYRRLLARQTGTRGERLRREAEERRQPLAGARQHLNQCLARLRAVQLQHVHLAQIFARMGYPKASTRQAEIVAVPSARLLCEISGRLTAGHHALDRGEVAAAANRLPQIKDILLRAIRCGALVDPWNVLGFQGQFSLFPAIENTVHDHRADVLVQLVRQILDLHARTWGQAAARGESELAERTEARLKKLARRWDRYATMEVSGIEHVSGREAFQSAQHVANALAGWRTAGAAAGDIAFWRAQVDNFGSPKAYALVVVPLLDEADLVASMALLMQWVGRDDQVALAAGDHSFHDLALRWFSLAARGVSTAGWRMAKKFLDYLEANAEQFWEVPVFDIASRTPAAGEEELALGEDESEADLFNAAYDEMTYRDSTDDGFDSSMLEGQGPATDFELDTEAERISRRLEFLITVARLWKRAAGMALGEAAGDDARDALSAWCSRARENRRCLQELLVSVHRFTLPAPLGTHESMVEFDRRRTLKETLLAKVVIATVETASVEMWLSASLNRTPGENDLPAWERAAIDVLRALFRGDSDEVRSRLSALLSALADQPILYVPLSRQGNPASIVKAKSIQQFFHALLRGLTRLGMIAETAQVIAAAQSMEHRRPTGEGAVTEFDRLFDAGFRGIVDAILSSARELNSATHNEAGNMGDAEMADTLQTATEPLLKRWLTHSRSLRLSVLERVNDDSRWTELKDFIERYGRQIFTPRFMNSGNLRAILHRGVDVHLKSIEDDPEAAEEWPLIEDLDRTIPRAKAVELLTLAIEAVVENYAEFKDFNTTTTQSDRGDLLYVLLDLLRLKSSYDRVAWNTRPVVMVHEVLVRRGWPAAAELWRRNVAQRTTQVADWHQKRLGEMNKHYGIRLPSICDRLAERFVRPLAIDRLKSLIEPAIDEARRRGDRQTFALLKQELRDFTEHPSGSGLDVPAWLIALEEEVGRCERADERGAEPTDIEPPVPQRRLDWNEVQQQVKSIEWDDKDERQA